MAFNNDFVSSAGDSYRILTQVSYIPTRLRALLRVAGERLLTPLLSALYIKMDWGTFPLLVPCTVEIATLSLWFRAEFAQFLM